MFMAAVAIVLVLASGYIWLTRGFFSALLNMLCVIVAGAIAFGVMEHVAYAVLRASPERGFFSFISGAAWSIGLAIPFAASLAILRLIVDKLIPHNTKLVSSADYAGGAVCGIISGVITAGIMVMTIGFLRVSSNFMGYQPVVYTSQGGVKGNLEREKNPIRPYVDEWTAELYERLSLASLRAPRPLARYHPEFHELPATLRFNFEEGKSRNTFAPKDFTVTHYYTVGDTAAGTPLTELTTDRWHENAQAVIGLDGQRLNRGYLAGFVIRFNSSARESGRNAQVLATNAQLRLVVQRPGGDSIAVHPIAVIAQQDAADPEMARFWYDADRVTATSLGGNATPTMAFEFAVPPGYQPVSLYVKGARYTPPAQPSQEFAGPTSRDMTIPALARGGFSAGDLNDEHAVVVETGRGAQDVIRVTNALGFSIRKGAELGLETEKLSRGGFAVISGDQQLSRAGSGGFVDQALQINRFAATPDTVIVQVDVSLNRPTRLNGPAFDATSGEDDTLYLLDANGIPYQAIGFVYEDQRFRHVRFTPGQPIKSLSELPPLSPSIGDQKLMMIFRCSFGGNVEKFIVGKQVVATFDPPIALDQSQN
ncbi:MAG: hypothetical protein ACF8R7_00250 [Phycisphaerales bacterium JB039]